MKWICYVLLCHFCVLKAMQTMSPREIEDFSNYLKESSSLDQVGKNEPLRRYDKDEPISENAWEMSGKFEGDIILNELQRRMILSNVVEGLARNGVINTTRRWPNNEVVYFINRTDFNNAQSKSIQDAINGLARVSCVTFRPYQQGDKDVVVIQGGTHCFSQVGYQGGFQLITLNRHHPVGRGCFRQGTIIHELLHTLGFYHMHSSPDRDDYIDILWKNINKTDKFNFRKYNSYKVTDFGVGYDYSSVLHYGRKSFSNNGQDTVVPKNGSPIGQRKGLSQKDVMKLNIMYCNAVYSLTTENDTESDAE